MKFYDTLSSYYDQVFPLSNPCKTFIEKHLTEHGRKILDVGCSTGELDIFLGKKGYEVLGIDLDQKMIGIAREKIMNQSLKVEFEVMNMNHLEEKLSFKGFDGIICVGNTLVHLPGMLQIKEVLKQMVSLLNTGGILILQIINYDRIITQNVTELPTIENENIVFIREYDYDEANNKVTFKTTLEIKESSEKFQNEISLYPLRFEGLKTMLSDLGLKNIRFYGNFSEDPYDWNSYATVVAAQK